MTEREMVTDISINGCTGYGCSGDGYYPECVFRSAIACSAYEGDSKCGAIKRQALRWLLDNPEPKTLSDIKEQVLDVKNDKGDYTLTFKDRTIEPEEATHRLETYAEKLEKDCNYINDRLEKRESELTLRDENGLIAHYINGTIEVMPNTLSAERSKALNTWLTKMLQEA